MTIEKNIAGLWCHEVADQLEDYVAGTLTSEARTQLEAHVAECQHCASFGARYAALIASVGKTSVPEVDEAALASRISARLGTLE
jgi:anti-sigma factor RsiW